MAKTMKAAVVRKFTEPLSIEEMPVPEVGRGQILGRDRHLQARDDPLARIVLAHRFTLRRRAARSPARRPRRGAASAGLPRARTRR